MKKYLFRSLIVLFLISIYQCGYSNISRFFKDRDQTSSNYIASVGVSGVSAMTINKDSTKLFSVYKNGQSYCLNIVKLGYSINSADIQNKCFDSTAMLGTKIVDILFGNYGKAFYIFSKNDVVAYSISPITNEVKAKLFCDHLNSKIIQASKSSDSHYIFVLAKRDSSKGELNIYKINQDGSLTESDHQSLGYKPKHLESSGDNIYISGESGIYQYTLNLSGNIISSKEIIHLERGNIEDYSIHQKNSTDLDVLVAIRDIDSIHNKESGILRQYHVGVDTTREVVQKLSVEIPRNVIFYKSEDGSSELILVVYDKFFSFLDSNYENIKTQYYNKLLNVSRYLNYAAVSYSVDDQQSWINIFDLNTSYIVGEYHISDTSDIFSLRSRKFYAVADKDKIKIFQVARFL
ncbi:hypothetical protein FNFX1_1206 [Francisella cf. novicida Fx1]|uniref:hypothetical protein n=1 Tax=Francisella tularensis TaxID=263 RepID=UPI00020BCFD2|nr:hypothetical protein [Francisella tularensis]AEE87592.1 hypothetical protein FNFX1_1206 [Francisella cf. novicida Fx1]